MRRAALLLAVAALVAGCGDDEGDQEATASNTRLEVTIRPQGAGGPTRTRTVTDAGTVDAADLAPVPARQACTQIYRGPATATVTGRLDGRTVDARFSLHNGCEIARWNELAPLLGPPPR